MSQDIFSPEKRSEVMRKIRGRGSKLDRAMKAILERSNIRFVEYPRMEGNPDFLVEERVAVFCDSSFWHGRKWTALKRQLERGSRADYWVAHIRMNRRRDREVNATLKRMGFTVLRFWDTDIYRRPEWCLARIKDAVSEESI